MTGVTFTRTIPGTYNAATDSWVGASTSSITGNAIQVKGDPQRYEALGLTLSTMPTLLFAPTGYPLRAFTPEFVMPGDYVEWNGILATVKDVSTVSPDGTVVIARIIVST